MTKYCVTATHQDTPNVTHLLYEGPRMSEAYRCAHRAMTNGIPVRNNEARTTTILPPSRIAHIHVQDYDEKEA